LLVVQLSTTGQFKSEVQHPILVWKSCSTERMDLAKKFARNNPNI
jgi:hypothetical protein